MTLSDSDLRALESHARRKPAGECVQLTRDEALALLVEVRDARRKLAQWEAIAERDHGKPIGSVVVAPEEVEAGLRDELAHKQRVIDQRDRDWTALMVLIAQTIGTAEDREAAEMGEIEEFDPWHALRTYAKGRDSLAARLAEVEADRERMRVSHGFDEWHEDVGPALWWMLPVCEPPYCGTPLDDDWPFEDDERPAWTTLVVPPDTTPPENKP